MEGLCSAVCGPLGFLTVPKIMRVFPLSLQHQGLLISRDVIGGGRTCIPLKFTHVDIHVNQVITYAAIHTSNNDGFSMVRWFKHCILYANARPRMLGAVVT